MLNGLFAKLPDNATSIFHSDQGSQYQHSEYQNLLSEHNITQSMLRKGNYLKEYIYYYNNERIVPAWFLPVLHYIDLASNSASLSTQASESTFHRHAFCVPLRLNPQTLMACVLVHIV